MLISCTKPNSRWCCQKAHSLLGPTFYTCTLQIVTLALKHLYVCYEEWYGWLMRGKFAAEQFVLAFAAFGASINSWRKSWGTCHQTDFEHSAHLISVVFILVAHLTHAGRRHRNIRIKKRMRVCVHTAQSTSLRRTLGGSCEVCKAPVPSDGRRRHLDRGGARNSAHQRRGRPQLQVPRSDQQRSKTARTG